MDLPFFTTCLSLPHFLQFLLSECCCMEREQCSLKKYTTNRKAKSISPVSKFRFVQGPKIIRNIEGMKRKADYQSSFHLRSEYITQHSRYDVHARNVCTKYLLSLKNSCEDFGSKKKMFLLSPATVFPLFLLFYTCIFRFGCTYVLSEMMT